jgi:hypothetical protein
MRKIVEAKIPWRGSLTDLVTDVAYLLTPEEGQQFLAEVKRYLTLPHLADKWQGKGHTEVESG